MKLFQRVPSLIVTGPRNTGKTLSTEIAMSFLATNSAKVCVIKDTTLPALRERYTTDHFPLLIHDCDESATIVSALQECYEGRDVKKFSKDLAPGASMAITCNEQQMDYIRKRYGWTIKRLNLYFVTVPVLKVRGCFSSCSYSNAARNV